MFFHVPQIVRTGFGRIQFFQVIKAIGAAGRSMLDPWPKVGFSVWGQRGKTAKDSMDSMGLSKRK